MASIWQEFYCNDCDGYMLVRIVQITINRGIYIRCPNCQHLHPRCLENGQIVEHFPTASGEREEFIVPRSAYSKTPFNKATRKHARDGVIVNSESDLKASPFPERDPAADAIIKERWAELYGGRT